jgi:tRNA pseudouridine(55) synthase
MDNILNIYKPLGMTTFQAIEKFKEINPEYKNVPIAYTGRLDPMAEGVLVLLANNKRYDAKDFQKKKKIYTAKILFGFSTDSYDLLGVVKKEGNFDISKKELEDYFKKHKGKNKFSLPPYCAYKINGKPMFYLAREGLLNDSDIPKKEMIIESYYIKKDFNIEKEYLRNYIFQTINKVKGDFRQKEIIKNWYNILNLSSSTRFKIFEVVFEVSGGTYIRSIVNNLSKELNKPALLYHLQRNSVDGFSEFNSIKI